MDDTLLSKAEAGYAKSAEYGVFAEKPGALVGAGSPRFLVSPFNPDAPVEGGISGAAKGALAGFVPFGVPSGSGSPSSPSKHDGIGVSGRSQAHETLRTMTTIIMRTTDYDLIVVSGDATNYLDTFAQAPRLLREHGVIVFTDMLAFEGDEANGGVPNPADRSDKAVVMRQLLDMVQDDDRFESSLTPTGTGLLIAVKR